MKASDILHEYEKGRRDFQGVSLRGLSFKKENLSGADFSGADIRGTNFSGANLTGAKFRRAKAGLQRRWVVVLLIVVFILAGISGFFSLFTGYIISLIFDNSSLENQVSSSARLIVAILFWIVVISRSIVAAFGAFAGAFAFAVAGSLAFAVAGALAFAVATTLLSAYIAYRAMKGDEKHALIRNVAIAFAATGGTCFREADLTDANFSETTLKSTDFRKANLTRTCFRNTEKLDQVRPGKTYLQEAKVRELVQTGQGKNQNFDRLDLQGANLQGANLVNASFIEANLNIDIGENFGVVGKEGKFENYGVAGNKGEIKDSKFARNIYEGQQKTLAETAAEIQQLLKQLETSNSTETTAGKMAVVSQAIEIVENNPTLKQRVIGALKSGGKTAFTEALDHPVANVLVAAFEGWSEP